MADKTMCLNCNNRYPGCHDHCEQFLEFKKIVEERKDKIKKAKGRVDVYDQYKRDLTIKIKRRVKNYKRK